ncbi:delta-1-pyrroline-5-carboxylate dehydrogenase, mitochondrial [Trichechus manatus latirostris]|uniref:Delta-1-pyrroline-5-carboxylate dehydrogenase, mitochondrial n=1 Tax=Trichechus manatus latirostris TaxID=127582 RepID=A0A2Y9DMC2_TRIMA|nr:delta-1-pyrroline-5-carboxylate dehydrogenase, mitochondrial [Trichechus manatus latirostris]
MLLPPPALRRALLARPWREARLRWKHVSSLKVANEPVLAFTQGSPERDALQKALKDLKGWTEAIPCVVGDEEVWTSNIQYQVSVSCRSCCWFSSQRAQHLEPPEHCLEFAGLTNLAPQACVRHLWKQVAQNLDRFRTFPRLAGECGGKNFHFVHCSADVDSVVSGTLRSAFEYGGQKCSACSRLYVPSSLWPRIKGRLLEEHSRIKVGDPAADFGTFFSAVIDAKSFGRIKKWLEHARSSPSLTILAGGKCDDSVGYFVEPCIVESKDPQEPIMKEEIFGPVLTVYVYPDDKYKETLQLVDSTTTYGLTGAVFAQDKDIVHEATKMLRNAAGNFYINDKSTGSVVGQQPFGGARASGTNDKPGGPHYILRWTSPQVIKETHQPLGDWRYSYMQ